MINPSSLRAAVQALNVFFVNHLRRTECNVQSAPGLKWSQTVRASVAAVANSNWVVPASGGHRPGLCGAGAAHTLSTGPAVVLVHG